MITIEAELFAAVETNVCFNFVEDGIVKDWIEFSEFNDVVRRKEIHSLDFSSS